MHYNKLSGLKQYIFKELDSPHPLPHPQEGENIIEPFFLKSAMVIIVPDLLTTCMRFQ